MNKIAKALAVMAVLIGFAIVLGYEGGIIGSGINQIGLGLTSVLTSGKYLITLAISGVAIYGLSVYVVKKGSITTKQAPLLGIIGASIVFLQFGSRFSVFSVSPISAFATSMASIPALVSGLIGFALGFAIFYHTSIKKLF